MYEEIDYERLRSDLMNYFGSAMPYFPIAVIDLTDVELASEEKLEQIARQNGFDLNKYIKYKSR